MNEPTIATYGRGGETNPIDIHVGARIRVRRKLLKLNQQKVSDDLGITFQQLQKYERGTNRVSASKLYELSNVLGVSVDFFFQDMTEDVTAHINYMQVNALREDDEGELSKSDPMERKESMELVYFYYRIKDPETRKLVYNMARSLAGVQGDNDE